MSAFAKFKIKDKNIFLVYSKEKYAKKLYQVIDSDRKYLSIWLPWVEKTNSVESEHLALKENDQKLLDHSQLTLIIISKQQILGSIELHNIDFNNRTAEIGYWLASSYQGQGIMTGAVNTLVKKAFSKFNLDKLSIKVAASNRKSRAVAKRAGFIYEGRLKGQLLINGHYQDDLIYSIFNKKPKDKPH